MRLRNASMRVNPVRIIPTQSLVLESGCTLDAIAEASLKARQFLAQAGLNETELDRWELLFTEAGNNAVFHATDSLSLVRFEIQVTEAAVQACILDQTPGFDLPPEVQLPPVESERGRGLFLIQKLTDSASYIRGRGHN